MKKSIFISVIGILILLLVCAMIFGIKYSNYAPVNQEQNQDSDDLIQPNGGVENSSTELQETETMKVDNDFKEIEIEVGQMGKSFAVSGDAKKIAYTGYNTTNGAAEIWVATLTAELNTTNAKMVDTCSVNLDNIGYWNVTWLPDNSGIIYFSDEDYQVKIKRYTFKDDKTVTLRVIKAGIGISNISFGEVSPRVYYVEDTVDSFIKSTFKTDNILFNNEKTLFSIQTDTSGQKRQVVSSLDVSPNEEILAFSSYNRITKNYSVWTYNIKDKQMNMISDKLSHAVAPVWSPDGKYVAYSEKEKDGRYYMAIYNTQNENTTKMYIEGADITHPYWHPEGKSIFYVYSSDKMMTIRCRQVPINEKELGK